MNATDHIPTTRVRLSDGNFLTIINFNNTIHFSDTMSNLPVVKYVDGWYHARMENDGRISVRNWGNGSVRNWNGFPKHWNIIVTPNSLHMLSKLSKGDYFFGWLVFTVHYRLPEAEIGKIIVNGAVS